MSVIIELYGNTGFNSIDIPENLNIVRDGTLIKQYNNYNIIQTNNLAYIIIDDITEEDVQKVDYVIVSNDETETGYILTDAGYEFRADGTCKLNLIRDAYATCGGINDSDDIEIISGSLNRVCVQATEDDQIYFTEPEPFQPSEKLHLIEGIYGSSLDPSMTDEVYNFLETVVAPPKIVENIMRPTIPETAEVVVRTASKLAVDSFGRLINKGLSFVTKPNNVQEGVSTGQSVVVQTDEENQDVENIQISQLITPKFRSILQCNLKLAKLFTGLFANLKTGTMWWNGDNINTTWTDREGEVHKCGVLTDLRSSGAENGAVAYWSVPKNYVESMTDGGYSPASDYAGGISNIVSKIFNNTLIFTTTQLDYKNNKIYYSQALTIKIFNPVSGNELNKQAYEVRNADITPADHVSRADYCIGADLRSDGAPIFAFKHINGEDQTDSFVETLHGGNWRQIPLAATGTPNGYYAQRELDFEKKLNPLKALTTGVGGGAAAVGTATSIATALGLSIGTGGLAAIALGGGTLAAGGSWIANSIKQRRQQEMLDGQAGMAETALSTSTSNYLREIGRNSFYQLYTIYSENDIANFDRFLTLYGYKVNNKKISYNDFISRPHFNYIRVNDIDLKSSKYSMTLLNEINEQLKAGVRIWHHLPNNDYVNDGNK